MSAVSESVSQRMTLGHLSEHYGWQLKPEFASAVTVTSLADDLDSLSPGALYMSASTVSRDDLIQAQRRGAWAAVVPHSSRADLGEGVDLPLLFGEPTTEQLGKIASDMAGLPGNILAVFAVVADRDEESEAIANKTAEFLHMLGNPVGVIAASGSRSLERPLNLTPPYDILDVQRMLSVCAEDGVAAVVIALDGSTLRPRALQAVSVDVLGSDIASVGARDVAVLREAYGFVADKDLRMTRRNAESDGLAAVTTGPDSRRLSLAIAMGMAAGVRKTNVRNALKVAQELR